MPDFVKLRELSEQLLEKILLEIYNQDNQALSMGDYTKGLIFPPNEKSFFEKLGLTRKKINTFIDEEHNLRPVYQGQSGNVLGRIHDSVMLMCHDDHPEFRAYAVCLAKQATFFGRVYSETNGGVAVVLSLGLFKDLYAINHIYDLVESGKSLPDNKRIEYLVDMFCIISHSFGEGTLISTSYSPEYKDQKEVMKIHIITNCQQQYVLLHEYGHIATSYQKQQRQDGGIFVDTPSLENELAADEWAAKKISSRGEGFYPTWLQLRSLLWLFEFMHFVEVVERKKDLHELTARRRFDQIRRVIDNDGKELPLDAVRDMRQIMDDITSNWNLLYEIKRR